MTNIREVVKIRPGLPWKWELPQENLRTKAILPGAPYTVIQILKMKAKTQIKQTKKITTKIIIVGTQNFFAAQGKTDKY